MTSEILEKRVRLLLLTTRHEPRDVLPWRAGKIGRSVLDGLQLWDPQRPGCPQNRRPGTNVANRTADDGSGNRAHDADGGIPGVAPDGSNTPTPGIRRGPSKLGGLLRCHGVVLVERLDPLGPEGAMVFCPKAKPPGEGHEDSSKLPSEDAWPKMPWV